MSQLLIGKYQATIYAEGIGYTGAIDIGYDGAGRRQRIKRKGRTKAQVRDKPATWPSSSPLPRAGPGGPARR
jgi:hypothetical protein